MLNAQEAGRSFRQDFSRLPSAQMPKFLNPLPPNDRLLSIEPGGTGGFFVHLKN